MLFHLCYQYFNKVFVRFQMWSDFAPPCWDHKLWTKFPIATLSGLMINQRLTLLATMQPKWPCLDGKKGHRGARGGCMGNSEVVEKRFRQSSATLHFALCTLYLHCALCTSNRFPQPAATLHSVLCTLHFEKGFSTLLPLCTNSFQGALLRHALIAGARGCVAKASIFNQDPRFIFSLT